MSKVFIEESTLTSIGDAIRGKAGTSELIAPQDMGAAITNLPSGDGDLEPIILTGNCDYAFYGNAMNGFMDYIQGTDNISSATSMFYNNTSIEEIPFDINLRNDALLANCNKMFWKSTKLKTTPKITGNVGTTEYLFSNCYNLREIPDEGVDCSKRANYMDSSPSMAYMFQGCYSLRELPMNFIKHIYPYASMYYCLYYYGFEECYALNKISKLPVYVKQAYTSNMFGSTNTHCSRINEFTFAIQEDGMPYQARWKNQYLDFTYGKGYLNYASMKDKILNYNSGITADKEVKDDATYQALKNDPDWFTADIAYSRYNHDSAVATINSLPDTSAYLASAGGTNTVKFMGAAGSATDGGAINTLTETEIAVATAKGWTVSLV